MPVFRPLISFDKIETIEQGYLVCEEGICRGAFSQLPTEYGNFPVIDCGDNLIIPGMTDLHTHAPQYACRGFAMDLELLEWLNTYTFPQEARYADVEYAKRAYGKLVEDLRNSFTTRAVFFGTLHTGSAADSIDRMVQVFPEGMQTQIRLQLSMCLAAVLTQQLVKKRGGGRVLACEMMVVTDAIRNLIRAGNTPQIANAIATSAALGGQTMDQALVRLMRSGQISREVALDYAVDQAYVKKN